MNIYVLSKISAPGWEINSTHIEVIRDFFLQQMCDDCIAQPYNDENFDSTRDFSDLRIEDQIQELLCTTCGAEFDYTTFENYNDYYMDGLEIIDD